MLYSSETLDDPIVSDGQPSFRGGQVSNRNARDLAEDQAVRLWNCDITRPGNIVTRKGSVQLGGAVGLGGIGGLTFYDTLTNQYLVASTTGRPYKYDTGTATWVQLSASLPTNSGRQVSFAQGVNTLYLADGSNNIWSWDGTTAVDLGNAALTQPPAAPRYLCWHTNRLCAAGMSAERDAIYFSQFLDGATWDKTNWQIRVGAGEDDNITGLLSWTNFDLVVFKKRSVWLVDANPTNVVSDFEIKPIHRRVGCPNARTAVQVGSDIFFLSDTGVRSLRHTIATEHQSELGPALSEPIQDIIDRINWTNIHTAAAIFWNNRYILTYPHGPSSTMQCIVYNTLTDSWSGTWFGWGAQLFGYRQQANEVAKMCYVKGNETVWEFLDYQRRDQETADTYKDGATDINTQVYTRAMTFGEPRCKKTPVSHQVVFEDNNTSDGIMWARRPDDLQAAALAETLPVTNTLTGDEEQVPKSFSTQWLGKFRSAQMAITSNSGKLGVHSVNIAAMVDTLDLEE